MRKVSTLMFFLLGASWLWGSDETAPVVIHSTHYEVTSWAGAVDGQRAADLLESLYARFEAVLQISTKPNAVFKVNLYADKKSYLKAVGPLVGPAASDFVALSFSDPQRNVLDAWNAPDKESSWAFQGFLQWFWSIVPHPPAWIETGLAYYFWDIGGKQPDWQFGTHRIFADDVLAAWGDKGPDLEHLLGPKLPAGKEKDAWAFVTFLMNTSDPAYARAFGAILADLSNPASTDAQTNSSLALARLKSIKPLPQIAQDCLDWWKAHPGFGSLLQQAENQLKVQKGRLAAGFLAQALELRPNDGPVLYLAGLAAYEAQDFPLAEQFYQRAQTFWNEAPAGLLDYALGLTAFQTKDWIQARTHLEAAAKAAPATYTSLTQPLLAGLP
ncbi:MAG: hypothetical protein HKM06_09135 [Spirochaetales bacterium]|nr:hypothetical protein [Spirochaetales bacterium]